MCPLLHLCTKNATELDSWNCQTCIDLVAVLKKDLVNVSERDVESYIKSSVCSKVPFIARGMCNKYVSNLTPKFINDIKSSLVKLHCLFVLISFKFVISIDTATDL